MFPSLLLEIWPSSPAWGWAQAQQAGRETSWQPQESWMVTGEVID